jgi:hypothetical protein
VQELRSLGKWGNVVEALCPSQGRHYNAAMKLRIHANSIRFRITQSEMATLGAGGRLENSVQFGPAPSELLTYAVEVSSQCSEVRTSYSEGVIRVTIPANLARTLESPDQVGIEHVQPIAKGAPLKIILEKDFHCSHPRPDENESDNFPNPNKVQQTAKS